MITTEEIEQMAREFGIGLADLEKDYVYGWVLHGIYTQSGLRDQLILKGGNALRKAYLPSTRFSKDLDFSCREHLGPGVLADELKRICELIEDRTRVHFSPEKTTIRKKDLPTDIDAVEARLYFKGFYGEENITLKAQLDITQFDKIYLPVQERQLLHPYSDSRECSISVRCQKIEEILASKLTTLLHRRKVIDLFDLLYSIIFAHEFPVDRMEVVGTFLKKSIFEPRPLLAKDQLLTLPLHEYQPFWSTIIAPIRSLFTFDYVIANFRSLVELLFETVRHPTVEPATLPGRTRWSSSGPRAAGPDFFSWNVRNVIVTGGRTHNLIELTYDGFRRLVEPYKIEYHVRKSDGVGQEYFWGYDITGGRSRRIGIKQFICNKIQSARPTETAFSPRYQVEF